METAVFDYDLPAEAIAQEPAPRRDAARLLLVDRARRTVSHHRVSDLPELLPSPHSIFRNNARVLRARLRGVRSTGGAVECLLLRPTEVFGEWWCLLKPGKRFRDGGHFALGEEASAEVLAKNEGGEFRLRFHLKGIKSVLELAERQGEMPLPPYIRREKSDDRTALDHERYDTVYASREKTVAAAAPTAGLHFTPELNRRLEAQGHAFHDLTLHVGLDTFRPIQTERIEEHAMHSETYEIPAHTAQALRQPSPPRLAIGTTSLRASEDFLRKEARAGIARDPNQPVEAAAQLFVYPPDRLQLEALMTNFHLPRSTLLCLVSAFLTPGSTDGIAWLKEIYAEALRENYRFYSYGDAMLIL